MLKQLLPAAKLLLILTLMTGVIYPLVVTAFAQVVFPAQANGSLITHDDAVIGSALIGQANDEPRYFWSRPSAVDYAALPSSGSNLGPTSAALQAQVQQRGEAIRAANHLEAAAAIPPDLLFASASGLDPHISPEAAHLQAQRVANARGLAVEAVDALIDQIVEAPQLGFLGQPRVNVLLLNLALDGLQ